MFGKVQESAAARDHAVLPALAVRRGQGLRLLDHGELPRGLRPVRLQRHPVQPRVARCAARPSSPARSPAAWRASAKACDECLYLGNLDALRDWGHARDYVRRAVADAAAGPQPEDFVIATGEQHSRARVRRRCAGASSATRSSGAARASTRQGVDRAHRQGAGAGRPALLPPDRGGNAARRPRQGARPSSAGSPRSASTSWSTEMVERRPRQARRDRPPAPAGLQGARPP